MNKYKEALDELSSYISNSIHASKIDTYKERNQAGYYLNVLNELVEKATPKKPNDLKIYYFDIDYEDEEPVYECTTGKCPSCDCILEHHYSDVAYCPRCGQALDWSEEDVK